MKARQIQDLRESFSLDRSSFAKLCGVDARTVDRWERDEARPTGASAAVLEAFRHAWMTSGPLARKTLTERLHDAAGMGGLAQLLQRALK